MRPVIRIEGKVGFVEHICVDKTCSCHTDSYVQNMRGKWVVEIRMIDLATKKDFKAPLLLGPFLTEEEAESNMELIAQELGQVDFEQLGYHLERKKPNANIH